MEFYPNYTIAQNTKADEGFYMCEIFGNGTSVKSATFQLTIFQKIIPDALDGWVGIFLLIAAILGIIFLVFWVIRRKKKGEKSQKKNEEYSGDSKQ